MKIRVKKIATITLLALVLVFLCFSFPPVFAGQTETWDFSTASEYTYDSDKIQFSSGIASLGRSSWIAAESGEEFDYRIPITIDNTGSVDALTDYQAKTYVDYSNTDFWSHVASDGADVRITDSDGTTVLDHWMDDIDEDWLKSSSNPLFNEYQAWNMTYVIAPSVIKDGDTYKMWYTGYGGSPARYRIGYATSNDGTTWTQYSGNPVFTYSSTNGDWDDGQVSHPVVMKDGSTYKMWYAGFDGTAAGVRIGYATSSDGITWTRNSGNNCGQTGDGCVLSLGSSGAWDDYAVGGYHGSHPHWGGLTIIKDDSTYKMWYVGSSSGTDARIGYATSSDGASWTRYDDTESADCGFTEANDDGCVMDLGTSGNWDDAYLFSPAVIKDGSTYKMWYGGHDGSYTRIGYATSDDGASWARNSGNNCGQTGDGCIIDRGSGNTWDDHWGIVGALSVMKDDSTYKMWYSAYDNPSMRIGYATSSDGISWTKYSGNPIIDLNGRIWDGKNIGYYGISVIEDGGTYKMWYTANGCYGQDSFCSYRIGYATSDDGTTWTRRSTPVLDLGSSGTWDDAGIYGVSVLKDGSTYKMWYGGWDSQRSRIGYATSSDGITWTKNPGNNCGQTGDGCVFDKGGTGDWDIYRVGFNGLSVIKDDTTYKMWYTGYNNTNYRIGYATSDDGASWTRYDDPGTAACGFAEADDDGCVFDLGSASDWDYKHIYANSVVKDGSTYKMWYTGYDNSKYRVGYATSSDGASWTRNSGNVCDDETGDGCVFDISPAGYWDGTIVSPAVIQDSQDSNRWKMWYSSAAYVGYAYKKKRAEIWTKVPSISAASSQTIYLYYGNSSVSSSSTTSTFAYFDDFSGTTIDTNKWTEYDTGSDYITQNDKIIVSGGPANWDDVGLVSKTDLSRPFTVQVKWLPENTNTAMFGIHDGSTSPKFTNMPYASYIVSGDLRIYEDGTTKGDTGYDHIARRINNSWYLLKWEVRSTGDMGCKYSYSTDDGASWTTYYNSVYSSEDDLRVGFNILNQQFKLDNFIIHKYADVEPSSSVGSEQAIYPSDSPTIVNNTGVTYGNIAVFSETTGTVDGSIRYQVSDDGSTWYYYNTSSGDWESAGSTDYNSSSEVNTNIPTFDDDIHSGSSGTFYWKTFLISDGTQAVELDNLQITYAYDSEKPTNPGSASGYSDSGKGTSLTSNNWYNHTAPYFEFTAGTDSVPSPNPDGEIASGIQGYWVYFGPDQTAIPKDSGTWQAGNQASDRVYQADLSSASSGTYYLRIQSKDIAQNEAEYTSSTPSLFVYKYDITAPPSPGFVSVYPQGYASTNEFTFIWPAVTDTHSGIDGYCYKTEDPDFPDEAQCGEDGKFISGTTISTADDPDWVKAYQDGENIFYVRPKDIAGNYSSWIQTTYYFSGTAPSPPQNLAVSPLTTEDSPSTTNSFAFSWEKPAAYTGDIKGYYYSINSEPTQDNSTFTTSTSLASGPFATSQGKNTFYVVAQDTAENIHWDAYVSVDFYCETSAPPMPTGVNIADSSNREEEKYALTITWSKPEDLDENTFSHYIIERSIDSANSEDFEDIAHTEALGYLDTGLDTTKTYYYRIKTCDNADSISSPSSVVYLKPTGRYTIPPEIIVLPKVEPRISSATITWKTDREASSFVQFGTTGDLGEEQGISEFKEDHQVTIVALRANTTYYYRVKSEGVDGNIAYSPISTFKTADAPSAPQDLKVSPSTSSKKPASENLFTFSWSKPPDPGITIKGYWYSINDLPSKTTATYTTKTKVGSYSFATRQGENVFYVVAQDDQGNVNFSNFTKISFWCKTRAPGVPRAITIVDASNRDTKDYALALKWSTPKEEGSGIDKYVIERAESKVEALQLQSLTFTQIATVPGTSTGYLDTNLDTNKVYTFQVKASDDAGALSAASSEVSLRPEGRYTTPPTISNVKLEPQSFGVKVTWKTDRPTSSHIQFGKESIEEKEQGIEELVEEHEVIIAGLDPETTYLYRVKCVDRDENEGYSDISTFKTLEAPKVSEVSVSDIALTSAIISWKTNLITTSKIEYGATTDYGLSVYDVSESKITSHTLRLTALSSGTLYHFRATGIDLYGNTVFSDDYTFSTPPYPGVISQTTENKAEGQTEVRWTTNVPTTSQVEYWSEEANIAPKTQGTTPKVIDHAILLFGLEDDTTYQFRLRGRDQFGNEAVSDVFTFHTLKDTTPPVITEVYSESNVLGFGEKQKVQIIVAWKTNEPATSKVYYGEGISGEFTGETEEFGDLVLEHLVVISDLSPSKIYHFKVESFDKARNSSQSETFTVLTSRKRESLLQLIVGVLEDTFSWVRNVRF